MSPIEEHLVRTLRRELAAGGVTEATVTVLSAEAENWRYAIAAAGRTFELGFSHRDRLWVRETTADTPRHLISNDHAPVNESARARAIGVRLIAAALANPAFPPRDPPVI